MKSVGALTGTILSGWVAWVACGELIAPVAGLEALRNGVGIFWGGAEGEGPEGCGALPCERVWDLRVTLGPFAEGGGGPGMTCAGSSFTYSLWMCYFYRVLRSRRFLGRKMSFYDYFSNSSAH